MGNVLFSATGIGDDQVTLVLEPGDDKVINDPAALIQKESVFRRADFLLAGQVGASRSISRGGTGPLISIWTMCEISNRPALFAVCRCSFMMPSG